MSRNASGVYALPNAPVGPAGTTIFSNEENVTRDDIASALTDSLSRKGEGGMQAPLRLIDGTVAVPGMSWGLETNSGWYRKSAGEFWFSVGGTDIFKVSVNGIEVNPSKTALGFTVNRVQDADPAANMVNGEQWWESDTGGHYMRYKNPDDTFTYVALGGANGDFVPTAAKGIPNGVATLDSAGRIPVSQLPGTLIGLQNASGLTAVEWGVSPTARRITVLLRGVSNSAGGQFYVQLRTGGAYSGTYTGGSNNLGAVDLNTSAGFQLLPGSNAADNYTGRAVLDLMDVTTNTWIHSGQIMNQNGGVALSNGAKVLTTPIDAVRVILASGTYDAGAFNLTVE